MKRRNITKKPIFSKPNISLVSAYYISCSMTIMKNCTNAIDGEEREGNLEGMLEERWGKPEVRQLEVRLRTNWSHCANIDAGPAVMSPNMFKTCIHQTSFNLFHFRENPIQKKKNTLEVTLRVKGASASSSFSTSPLPWNSYSQK